MSGMPTGAPMTGFVHPMHLTPVVGCECNYCDRWVNDAKFREVLTAFRERRKPATASGTPAPTTGPGTAMQSLWDTLGLKAGECKTCSDWRVWMNRLGPEGCWRNFHTIVGRVRDARVGISRRQRLRVWWAAVRTGLAFELAWQALRHGGPFLPIPALVAYSIRKT